jgi:DNA-binding NarL/FixJ family response regulator
MADTRLQLTEKDVKILQLLADGESRRIIAEKVGYKCPSVIRNRLCHIREILGADNTEHAIATAFRKGLIQ